MITKDNVTVRVEAAVFYRVVDPVKAVVAIRDYEHGVLRIAQTTLRATLGQHELDGLLANQAAINELLKQIIDSATEPWGVTVVKVETKDVDLPDTMKRAMARQAEAERERRAKVIAAEGEYQAADRLSQAAGVIAREPGSADAAHAADARRGRHRAQLDAGAADPDRRSRRGATDRGRQAHLTAGRPPARSAGRPTAWRQRGIPADPPQLRPWVDGRRRRGPRAVGSEAAGAR